MNKTNSLSILGRVSSAAFCLTILGALTASCGKPAPRDPSGRVLFQPEKIRHRADTPYFCYTAVSNGDELSDCEVIKEWCVSSLEKAQNSGSAITSGCVESDKVWCFSTGRGNAHFCQKSPEDCEKAVKKMAELVFGDPNEVSTCNELDRSFQPKQ